MPADTPAWLREIDHTGDVGLHVRAASLPQLFERAAEGMFRVLTDIDAVRPTSETALTVTGRDREALMVRWLSELNYYHTVDDQLFCAFAVASVAEAAGELTLAGTARGESIAPERHVVHTEIKAITFHGMEIQETTDGWTVQVIFDM